MSCKTFKRWILFALMAAPALMASSAAQTYTVLYKFTGNTSQGPEPGGPLVLDSAGNLYGTTFFGGDYTCDSPLGCGTVFRLNAAGKLASVSLNGSDGQGPVGGVLLDNVGNAFGTASTGGDLNCNSGAGCGTVYKVNRSGVLSAFYTFTGPDGDQPLGGLITMGGKLFGVTGEGGSNNQGTVFSLDSSGSESVLHSFTGGADGSIPDARLVADSSGNLYGTTASGGAPGFGVAFQVATSNDQETVLHVFTGPPFDAYAPSGILAMGSDGSIYGTSTFGGNGTADYCDQFGCGAIFKLTPSQGSWTESLLYSFQGAADGAFPGGVVIDQAGNLYGTTSSGGDLSCGTPFGCGVVFRLDPHGNFRVLHTFHGGEGAHPIAAPLLDSAHQALYGSTASGGNQACSGGGCGVIWRITP
jgi:uncharacterized repeat protein (TIGR03803 family)